MKCPNCNAIVADNYNFCPKCRCKLNKTEQNRVQKDDSSNSTEVADKGMVITKNKAIWQIEKGEIARHIKESDFANFSSVSGLIINEGVTAIIYVDGVKVDEISGGAYNFVSDAEIEKIMNQRIVDNKSLYGIGSKLLKGIVHLICGKKVKDNVDDTDNKQYKSKEDIIEKLTSKSVISAYLKTDAPFPLLYGTKINGDTTEFLPIKIRTKYLDAEFGVSLLLKIVDFEEFIRNYFHGNSSVTTSDVQQVLQNIVPLILQEELRDEEIDEYGISPAARNRILLRFKSLDSFLHGVSIVNVGEITCSNNDMERFRALAKDLYCSEKELDFLKRTNDFKNRLAEVENDQKIKQAKTDLELKIALDEINRDGMLHKDEEEQFYVLLSRQKRIREAQNDMELQKALNDIKKTNLLNEDELEEFEKSLDFKKFDRNNVDQIMRQQSLEVLAKKSIETQAAIMRFQIETDSDIDDVKFEAHKKELGRTSEELDIMETLYGKQYISKKARLEEELELTSLTNRFNNAAELERADTENALLIKELQGRKSIDDYEFEKARREEDRNLESLQQQQNMALNALQRIKAMEAEEARLKHDMEMDKARMDRDERERQRDLEHQERMTRLDNERNFTAEQLFVSNMSSYGEGNKAAEVYAAKFSSEKELEAERKAQEKIEAERMRSQQREKELVDEQSRRANEMMERMMGFAERVATHKMDEQNDNSNRRIDDLKAQKEEYRQQMMHEQQRHDVHQDKALDYTTKVTEIDAKYSKPTPASVKQEVTYSIDDLGSVAFTLSQIKALVSNGVINKRTVVKTSERKCYAEDIRELREAFEQCDFVVCPSCKSKVAKEQFCPNCGAEI